MIVVGIDVGGTFTDVVAVDQASGRVLTAKHASRPDAPAAAIIAAFREMGLWPARLGRLIHGTTIATNALIERRGARTGLLTTAGCRDVIEIGRGRRLVEGGMFDVEFRRPAPLVPRERRVTIRERLHASGTVLHALLAEDVRLAAERMRAQDVEAVAICFLHAYRNDAHERAAARELTRALGPDVFVTTSSTVNPAHREFERFSTTVVNAYVGPKVAEYLAQLDRDLGESMTTGATYVMSSAGGIMDLRTAGTFPVNTILSGPAGGVTGARLVAIDLGLTDVIACDMGGTSTDVSLLKDNAPLRASETIVSGIPIRSSQLDINTIGAGAGSIVWLDADGALAVGPHSAGAFPGPACYGHGGTRPTITDANVVLGRIADGALLGGQIRVDGALAARAFAPVVETGQFATPVAAAQGALDILVAKTARAIGEISLQRGFDPRDFTLVAFGGAGPMHCAEVADMLGIKTVVVPNHAGILSAVGLARADVRKDAVATHVEPVAQLDCDRLRGRFEAMRAGLAASLATSGVEGSRVRAAYLVEMRCVGQSHELLVGLGSDLAALSRASIEHAFATAYERRYGRAPDKRSEIVQLRVEVEAHVDDSDAHVWQQRGSAAAVRVGSRVAWFKGARITANVYRRESLQPGERFAGPAIVEEHGATTVVPPQWQGEVAQSGHLVLSAVAHEHGNDAPGTTVARMSYA